MRNFASLILFFTLCFAGILLFAGFLDLLREWAGAALLFPPLETAGEAEFAGNVADYARRALPAAFYLSLLLGLNYAARRRMIYPVVLAALLVLVLTLSAAVLLGIKSLDGAGIAVPAGPGEKTVNLVKPGFIISPGQEPAVQAVFLEDPYKTGAARAVSPPGQSLYYQRHGPALVPARLPFTEEKISFFESVGADFLRSARHFTARFEAGFLPYGVYAGSLAVLLLSLGCLVNISFWSLANLFFGALAFRGALALETFLNQADIHRLLASFAGKFISESLITPLIFTTLGILILLYSALVYLARGRIFDG
ncbi:MAG: hypothetical protein LBG84_03510 [Treponema sp.]|nr:hypothetical protein [Treponema sp.]